jgi:WD40 repeat protein
MDPTHIKALHDKLRLINTDGTEGPAHIVSAAALPKEIQMSRRGAPGADLTSMAAQALLQGSALSPRHSDSRTTVPSDYSVELTSDVSRNGPAHVKQVTALAFSSDGKWLASGSSDRTIKFWALPEGVLVKILDEQPRTALGLTFSPDGNVLVSLAYTAGFGAIELWSVPDGTLLNTIDNWRADGDHLGNTIIRPDGTLIVATHNNNVIRLRAYSLRGRGSTRIVAELTHAKYGVFSPDGSLFLTQVPEDKSFELWALPQDHLTGRIDVIKRFDNTIDFGDSKKISPDGTLLTSQIRHQEMWTSALWSLPDGNLIKLLDNSDPLVLSLGNTLLVSRDYCHIKLWRLPEGTLIKTLRGHENLITSSVAISPDGRLLASGDARGRIRLWTLPASDTTARLIDFKSFRDQHG